MRGTRKLQIASELVYEVAQETDDHALQKELEGVAVDVDEMRPKLHQLRVKEVAKNESGKHSRSK